MSNTLATAAAVVTVTASATVVETAAVHAVAVANDSSPRQIAVCSVPGWRPPALVAVHAVTAAVRAATAAVHAVFPAVHAATAALKAVVNVSAAEKDQKPRRIAVCSAPGWRPSAISGFDPGWHWS